ncbi:MAG: hypothetical protein IT287_02490 [Bdellovibrionaceae bacterium]|nr:hypothetical protein [Pseudobdellovibrionaceae bacterium]
MNRKILGLVFTSFVTVGLLVGCDSLDSSFGKDDASGGGAPTPPAQKPSVCEFDFAKTCWADSAAQITSCLGETTGSEETFSKGKEFCTNDDGKLIAFANPNAMFAVPFDVNNAPIDFRVFPDSVNECLRVTGTPQKFKVILSASKKSMDFDFTSDKMKFTCLDGQTVQVPYEAFQGCAQSLGDKFVATVPGLQMMLTQKGNKARWSFKLRGAPDAPELFKCIEP